MKYFIDTEFKEKPNTIDFISIGIVTENGDEYYAISKDFNLKEVWKDDWLRENVLKTLHTDLCKMVGTYGKTYHWGLFEPFTRKSMRNLIKWYGKTNKQIGDEIKEFVYKTNDNIHPDTVSNFDEIIKKRPIEFYAYYADYDWVVFCWLFGRMMDLPKGFPMYCKDLKQTMDDNGFTKEWKQKFVPDDINEHNAIADAKWNLKLFNQMVLQKPKSVGKK